MIQESYFVSIIAQEQPSLFPFVSDNSMLHPVIPPAVKIYLCLCFDSGIKAITNFDCMVILIKINRNKYQENSKVMIISKIVLFAVIIESLITDIILRSQIFNYLLVFCTPVLFAAVNGYYNKICLRLETLIVFFYISLLSPSRNIITKVSI